MAKISLSPLVVDIRNKVADMVFSKWRGINYVRSRVTPSNPNTQAQQDVRNSLARCVDMFQGMQATFKAAWNYVASGKSYSGYNRMVSENRAVEEAQTGITGSPTTDVSSVATFTAATGGGSSDIAVTFTPGTVPTGKKLQIFARVESQVADKNVITETFEIAAAETSPQTLAMGEAAADYVLHGCFSDDTLARTGASIKDSATSSA